MTLSVISPSSIDALFDYLIGKRERHRGNIKRASLRAFEVKNKFELGDLMTESLLGRACRHIDLDEHSRPSERGDDEKCAGRLGRARVRLGAAFAGVEEISDVRDISDDLVDVVDGCAVFSQQPFDLVPGISALRAEIAEVADGAPLRR